MTMRNSFPIFLLLVLLLLQTITAHNCGENSDCANGGTCESEVDGTDHADAFSSRCICASGFWGEHCEKVCPISCENGGQCEVESDIHGDLDVASDFVCNCPAGFDGPLCSSKSVTEGAQPGQSSSSSSMDAGAVVGITLGTLVGVLVLGFGVMRLRRKEKAGRETEPPNNDNQTTTETPDVFVDEDTFVEPDASIT